MKVTVCQLRDDPKDLHRDWEHLVAHVRAEASQMVILPEMPFSPWFARTLPFDPAVWYAALKAHDAWQNRLCELSPAVIICSRPINSHNWRLNEGFIWESELGYRSAHCKHYLPDEEGYWEASWYQRGDGDFTSVQHDNLRIGFLICTELWFLERARAYGKAGVHLLVTPRASRKSTADKWLVGGRAGAIVSGAFSLSSNRAGSEGQSTDFGGQGWVIGPDGQVLGLTSHEQPCVTVEIDLSDAERAKRTYPRYVLE